MIVCDTPGCVTPLGVLRLLPYSPDYRMTEGADSAFRDYTVKLPSCVKQKMKKSQFTELCSYK